MVDFHSSAHRRARRDRPTVDRAAPPELGLDVRQVGVGIGLGELRDLGDVPAADVPVARLPPPRGEPPDRSELSSLHSCLTALPIAPYPAPSGRTTPRCRPAAPRAVVAAGRRPSGFPLIGPADADGTQTAHERTDHPLLAINAPPHVFRQAARAALSALKLVE